MSKRTFVVVAEDGPEIFDTLRDSIEDGHMEKISNLQGVASVSEEMTAKVPSPDSDERC